jgi:glycosyltransferase involved in cell wall biosynthesis
MKPNKKNNLHTIENAPTRMRVFVIGPIFPIRGGIAHSNRMLCENLAKKHDVTAISFSCMFPKLLYPGKEQREPNPDPTFQVKTEYLLDFRNPLSWIGVGKKIREEKPDWVVFQWWHTIFTPMFSTIIQTGKNDHTRFSTICQNVLPHESGKFKDALNSFLTRAFFRQMDYLITLSSSDLKEVRSLMPGKKAQYIIECTYESQFGMPPGKLDARKKIDVSKDDPTILFFGFVRPYKGLRYLLEALPLVLKKYPKLKLMIVGEFWSDKAEYTQQIARLGLEEHLLIIDKYVSNEEVPTYFSAADAVVLPYSSSSESGIIQLAYGLNTPIITTAVGGNVDLVSHEKTGLLCRPEDPEDLARVIIQFFDQQLEKPIKKAMRANMHLFRWTPEKEATFFGEATKNE